VQFTTVPSWFLLSLYVPIGFVISRCCQGTFPDAIGVDWPGESAMVLLQAYDLSSKEFGKMQRWGLLLPCCQTGAGGSVS